MTLRAKTTNRRGLRARRGDDGFTVVELMVASMLILLVMTALATVFTGSLTQVAFSKQRQNADALLNQTMEQIRALPIQDVANGLSNSDSGVSSDPLISGGSVPTGTWTFVPTGETIVHAGNQPASEPPLVPHISPAPVTVDGTPYTIKVYPTIYSGNGAEYRVSVYVSWTNSMKAGVASSVNGQTLVYTPGVGCLATTSHPYAGPCQTYFNASANTGSPVIKISPDSNLINAITNIPLSQAELFMNWSDSIAQTEQTMVTTGNADTDGAHLEVQGQSTQDSGVAVSTVDADNDPLSSFGTSASSSASNASGASAVSYTDAGAQNSITLTPSTSDSSSSVGTVSASASPACQDLAGSTLLNSQPCSSATANQTGAASVAATIYGLNASLGSANLASVAAQPAATRSFASRQPTSSGGYCVGTSGDGCIHAGAQRSFGNIALGALPAGITSYPTGWGTGCNGSGAPFDLAGYSDSASAESGINAAAPAANRSGTIYYWSGAGCSTIGGSGQGGGTVTLTTLSGHQGNGNNRIDYSVSGSFTYSPYSTSTSTNVGCVSTCTASASTGGSGSILTVSLVYQIWTSNGFLADLDINMTLTSLQVSTAYRAAT